MAVAVEVEESLAAKFAALLPHLDERQQRLYLGSEARSLGHGGVAAVARAAGVSRPTVTAGVAELEAGGQPLGRARRAGGGRKPLAGTDPGLRPALLALVDPGSRGDPESPLRWTTLLDPQPGGRADPAGAPGGARHGGEAAEGGALLAAGQRQDRRGRPPPRPGRPVPVHQRPGQGAPGRRTAGDQRGRQEERKRRQLQERRPGMAAQGQPRAGQRARLQGQGAGQGHALRRLRRGGQRRMGVGGHRPRHRRVRGPDDPHLVARPASPPTPARRGC